MIWFCMASTDVVAVRDLDAVDVVLEVEPDGERLREEDRARRPRVGTPSVRTAAGSAPGPAVGASERTSSCRIRSTPGEEREVDVGHLLGERVELPVDRRPRELGAGDRADAAGDLVELPSSVASRQPSPVGQTVVEFGRRRGAHGAVQRQRQASLKW